MICIGKVINYGTKLFKYKHKHDNNNRFWRLAYCHLFNMDFHGFLIVDAKQKIIDVEEHICSIQYPINSHRDIENNWLILKQVLENNKRIKEWQE